MRGSHDLLTKAAGEVAAAALGYLVKDDRRAAASARNAEAAHAGTEWASVKIVSSDNVSHT
jgi:hypothetical protein